MSYTISGSSCVQLPIFKLYFSLIGSSAIRIQLKRGEPSRKVTRATERVVKGTAEANTAPNADSTYYAVANSNYSPNASPT